MKKVIAIILALVMVMGLVACGESAQQTDQNQSDGPKVDEGLLNVEVTLPASFFEDMTAEEIQAEAEEEGYSKCVINDDGSVTYTMTKAKRQEMLDGFKQSIDETIEEMIHGEDAMESFQSIEYNDNLSEVTVYVDPATYTSLDAFSALAFFFMGAYYQVFSGTDPDTVDVVVNFVDNETGETKETMSYRDFMELDTDTEADAAA